MRHRLAGRRADRCRNRRMPAATDVWMRDRAIQCAWRVLKGTGTALNYANGLGRENDVDVESDLSCSRAREKLVLTDTRKNAGPAS